jgi:hypothetical protein
VVEQVARSLREEIFAQLGVVTAAVEEIRDRVQLDIRERDQEVGPEEDVELGRVQPLHSLVVEREVEYDEQVLGVLVDLRPLAVREHVLDVELVEPEALGERGYLTGGGLRRVDPGEPVSGELFDATPRRLGDLAHTAVRAPAPQSRSGESWPCHRYLAGRPVASKEILPGEPFS